MKLKGLIGIATAGIMLLSGCAGQGGKTAITVGDTNITEGVIKFAGEKCTNTTDAEYVADLVKQCYVVNAIAEKSNITLDDDEQEKATTYARNLKQKLGGTKETKKILKEYGIKEDVINVLMSTSVYASKIMNDITIDDPTEDEMREAFKNDYIRAKHVLINTQDETTGETLSDDKIAEAEQTANEVLEKAQNGEDFDSLIEQYNEDKGMASNPDGYFFTEGDMVKEFYEAAKSIQPGEFVLCKTTYGYHVIERLPLDENDEKFEEYYEANKSSVESTLASNKQIEALENKAEELGIKITEYEDVIKNIVIEN